MTQTLTILGCGSSGGVPRIGGDWGACDPSNPKNRRRRCSVLVAQQGESGITRVLIDTSPDLREQMLSANIRDIDGVLYTHEHADHTHGIDDLRAFYLLRRKRVELWADEPTGQMLSSRFTYCFFTAPGSDYPPVAALNRLEAGVPVEVTGAGGSIPALPFRVHHGNIDALGFRFGGTAYTPDLNGIPDESLAALEGLDLWIVDALRYTRHPSHLSLAETLGWIEKLKPRRAIITNMHVDLDFETLKRELPPNAEPAYDGMVVDL
ncbi:MBL fold metallo-hydrolase [Aestuariivirga sp.]|uniref:MBL fold metallo-hydrolase n=1 Tax=Aestuariivirga sp. TaxID=2650926 RepID=UPI0039E705A2